MVWRCANSGVIARVTVCPTRSPAYPNFPTRHNSAKITPALCHRHSPLMPCRITPAARLHAQTLSIPRVGKIRQIRKSNARKLRAITPEYRECEAPPIPTFPHTPTPPKTFPRPIYVGTQRWSCLGSRHARQACQGSLSIPTEAAKAILSGAWCKCSIANLHSKPCAHCSND